MNEIIAFFVGLMAGGTELIAVGIVMIFVSVWSSGRMAGQQLVTRRSRAQARAIETAVYVGVVLIIIGLFPFAEDWLKSLGLVGNIALAVCVLFLLSVMAIKHRKNRVKN